MSSRSVKAVSAAAMVWGAMTAEGGLSVGRIAAAAKAGKRVALLVGVDTRLRPGFRPLRFAEADLQAVGAELRNLGSEATILLGSGQGLKGIEGRGAALPEGGSKSVSPRGRQPMRASAGHHRGESGH